MVEEGVSNVEGAGYYHSYILLSIATITVDCDMFQLNLLVSQGNMYDTTTWGIQLCHWRVQSSQIAPRSPPLVSFRMI